MDFAKSSTAFFPFYRLESESSTLSNDDTESVNSWQDKETDLARDTSDTEQQSINSQYEVEIEYEVDSLSDSDINSFINTSDESDVEEQMVLAATAVLCDSSFEKWVTDNEDSDSTADDISFSRTDFWSCVKCKSRNNNPLFRYCEKCFQDRKTLFPPRPRHKKSRKNKKRDEPVKLDTLRSCLSGLSQLSHDSGIGSSQECPPLGLDKIVIPDHLSENSSISSKSTGEDEDIIPSSQPIVSERKLSPSTSKQVPLNDIVKNIVNRKRQMSESSLSDIEVKKPRWRDIKKSPSKGKVTSPNREFQSSCRKRQSAYSDQDLPNKKRKTSNERQSPTRFQSNSVTSNKAEQECNVISCRTSDLGSEISSGSGTFDKAEDSPGSLVETKEMCIFCNTTPKNAIFLHGNIAHMCCCYRCAKKTWRTIKRCPICNRKINNVVRVYKT